MHVRELVRQDTAQLVLVDDLQETLGDGHRGVLGVAAGGEGVRLRRGADVDGRHRQAGTLGEVADDGVELRRLGLGDRLGAGGPDGDLVGEPVRPADEHEREHEPDEEAQLGRRRRRPP